MSPRSASAASAPAVNKARAEARARALSGKGAMSNTVDGALLRTELTSFYKEDPSTVGDIALRRVKKAMDAVAYAASGQPRMQKSATRVVWRLLSEELNFALNHGGAERVKPLSKLVELITSQALVNDTWDMGRVRTLLSLGWPGEMAKLDDAIKNVGLGPLHWWLVVDKLDGKTQIRREDIYERALDIFRRKRNPAATTASTAAAGSGSRNAITAESTQASGSRPARQAAGATNAALRKQIVIDDDAGSTYAPSERETAQFTFGNGTPREFTATAPPPAVPAPPPPPPAVNPAAAIKKTQPSPWLAPTGFSADLKWGIGNFKKLTQDLLSYPAGQPLPDGLVWEHPNMHGVPLDDQSGEPTQFTTSCTNCAKRLRRCIFRGSKACLPCFWDKGSMGKCEGGVPPMLTAEELKAKKPDFRVRLQFIQRLVDNGKMEFPSHYLDASGRSLHGAASNGTGKPPRYNSPPVPPYRLPTPPQDQHEEPNIAGPTASTEEVLRERPTGRMNSRLQAVSAGTHVDLEPTIPAATAALVEFNGQDVDMAPAAQTQPATSRKRARAEQEAPETPGSGAGENASAGAPPRPRKKKRKTTDPISQPPVKPAPAEESTGLENVPAEVAQHVESPPAAGSRTASPEAPVAQQDESRHAAQPPQEARRRDAGKGKAPAHPKPTGNEQRSQAQWGSRTVQFSEPVPGTRSIARASSPTEFRVRPTPVIPDQDMRLTGDRTYAMPQGITPITYPHPTPNPTSTVNVSGDILLANHVERSMRQEARETRDQQRDWLIGRFKSEHMMPMHRELLEGVGELKSGMHELQRTLVQLTLRSSDDDALAQRSFGPSGDRHAAVAPGATTVVSGNAQPTSSARSTGLSSQGISEARMASLLSAVTEEMKQLLTTRTAPITGLASNLEDVARRLRDLEPIPGQVRALGHDFRDLMARVQQLENASPQVRVSTSNRDRYGQATSSLLVLRDPAGASPRMNALVSHSPAVGQVPAQVTPASEASPGDVREGADNTPGSAAQGLQSPHVSQPPAAFASDGLSTSGVSGVPRRSFPPSREETPTPAPRKESSARAEANAQEPPSPFTTAAGALTPQEHSSPLTAEPSPGNPVSAAPDEDADSSSDDEPMEAAEGWTVAVRTAGSTIAKRRAPASESEEEERPRKKRAGHDSTGEEGDEDAEGSVDDSEITVVAGERPTPSPPVQSSRPARGRVASSTSQAPAPTPGRRAGLRARPARGG